MIPGLAIHRPLTCFLLLGSALLAGCVSYEPRQLAPSIALSPEQLDLSQPDQRSGSGGVEFGLTVSTNESDSLFNIEVLPGVRVREVAPGGPADLAGLRAGDVVLSVNGTETNHPDTLDALSAQSTTGSAFTFRVRRGTAILESGVVARPRASAGAPLRELFEVIHWPPGPVTIPRSCSAGIRDSGPPPESSNWPPTARSRKRVSSPAT